MQTEKKGVTLVALTIIIITMVLLTGIVGVNISNLIQETGVKEYASELQQLEHLINDYKIRNNGNIGFTEHNIDITTISNDFRMQIDGEEITGNTLTLYEIDYDKIDAMDTNLGQQQKGNDDIYLYSNVTERVYYKLGYEYQGTIYYTLTEDLEKELGK